MNNSTLLAQIPEDCENTENITYTSTELGCIPNDPTNFASATYGIGLTFIGAVALIFIIYGGYMILSSQGEPEKIKVGRSYIVYSIIGLLLALGGFVFYQTIAQNILGIPGFQ